jgi:CTP:molybdopterin cytidylyltransferase MocA
MNHIFDRKLSHGNNKERTPFSAVYLAAGLSSRFGYRIKCLQEVGRLGETLLELSIRQLAKYGLSDVIIVVSRSTYPKVHLVAGDIFQGIPVTYCFQVRLIGCNRNVV